MDASWITAQSSDQRQYSNLNATALESEHALKPASECLNVFLALTRYIQIMCTVVVVCDPYNTVSLKLTGIVCWSW